MKTVFKAVSADGQYGLTILAEEEVVFPAEGTIELLGIFDGVKTFRFDPDSRRPWIYVGNDVEIVSGALVSERAQIGAGDDYEVVTIVVGTNTFVIRDEGGFRKFHLGVEVELDKEDIEELERSY